MISQPTTTRVATELAARPAPRRAPRAAKAPRRRVVDLHAHAWFDLFHGQGLTWPDGETAVETIAAAIRAAG